LAEKLIEVVGKFLLWLFQLPDATGFKLGIGWIGLLLVAFGGLYRSIFQKRR
jgi:hypothetical protein